MSDISRLLDGVEKDILVEPVIAAMGNYVREDFDDHYHLIFLSDTFELMFNRGTNRLEAIYIRPDAENYAKGNGLIPFGLSFDLSRITLRKMLGSPDAECKPGAKTILGKIPPWDLYKRDRVGVNIQYSLDETSIDQITVVLSPLSPFAPSASDRE